LYVPCWRRVCIKLNTAFRRVCRPAVESLECGARRRAPFERDGTRRCPVRHDGTLALRSDVDGHSWNHCASCWLPSVTDSPSHAAVLVVEDDIFERMGATDMFMDAGYRVLEAGNADEALRFFETDADIRLLFTDVSMPGSMSGADLARHVAARWPGIGIIVASGRPRPDRLPPSMRFHEKPYAPTAILRHAREMMLPAG
jgi:two-component system, response regulator PdtaR